MDKDVIRRLNAIASRFVDQSRSASLSDALPPFDVERPNFHDSKSEFNAEKKILGEAVNALEVLARAMSGDLALSRGEPKPGFPDRVDRWIGSRLGRTDHQTVAEFITRAAALDGFNRVLQLMLAELRTELQTELEELARQEAEFWSHGNRPPRHYPRVVALHFAQFVTQHTGQRPTVGVANYANQPSTEFGRALQEVFEVLGIQADVRNAATWAISQLTDNDLKPKLSTFELMKRVGSHKQVQEALDNFWPRKPPRE